MTEERKKILNTLKICKGQVDGIIKMVEEERYCLDITNQIFAASSLLSKANKDLLTNHIRTCVIAAGSNEDQLDEKIEELSKVFEKMLK